MSCIWCTVPRRIDFLTFIWLFRMHCVYVILVVPIDTRIHFLDWKFLVALMLCCQVIGFFFNIPEKLVFQKKRVWFQVASYYWAVLSLLYLHCIQKSPWSIFCICFVWPAILPFDICRPFRCPWFLCRLPLFPRFLHPDWFLYFVLLVVYLLLTGVFFLFGPDNFFLLPLIKVSTIGCFQVLTLSILWRTLVWPI